MIATTATCTQESPPRHAPQESVPPAGPSGNDAATARDIQDLIHHGDLCLQRGDIVGAQAFFLGVAGEYGPAVAGEYGVLDRILLCCQRLPPRESPPAAATGPRPPAPEFQTCDICGGTLAFHDRVLGRDWLRCSGCDLFRCALGPKEETVLSAGAPKGGKEPPGSIVHSRERYFCELFVDRLGIRDLLLYGAGWTDVFGHLRARGLNAVGCDLWRPLIEERRRTHGAHTFYHPADLPGDPFDLISAFEVFEHFLQPAAEVRKLAGLLKPEGCLFGCTDFRHTASLAEHPSYDPYYWRHGDHVTSWNWSSMRRVAGQNNLATRFFKVDTPNFAAKVFFALYRGESWRQLLEALPKVFHKPF